jgi:hypothetical protein
MGSLNGRRSHHRTTRRALHWRKMLTQRYWQPVQPTHRWWPRLR